MFTQNRLVELNVILATNIPNISISVFGRYGYLYWIPIFPLTKKGVSQCNNCQSTLEPKEMNDQLKMACDNAKSNAKTPIWYWSGLIVIAILISIGIQSSIQHDSDVITFIDEPLSGDVVEFKSGAFYSTFKIMSVTKDSIYVIYNDYETDKISGVHQIDKDENYTSEEYSISKTNYIELFNNKEFLDVNRD